MIFLFTFYNCERPYNSYKGDNLQNQTISPQIHYTTLLYDLADNINQRTTDVNGDLRTFENRCPNCPIDNVENFTSLEIENSMIGARSLGDFRRNLEALQKDSNADLEQLFNNW